MSFAKNCILGNAFYNLCDIVTQYLSYCVLCFH